MRSRGFTLIELLLVMLLLAISAMAVSSFFGHSVQLYQESARQQNLLAKGRFALERISRELRQATPNSVRWGLSGGVECLEFVPISRSGIYRNLPLYPNQANALDVVTVGSDWTASAGQRLSVYATLPEHIYQTNQGRTVQLPTQTLDDGDGNPNTRRLTLPAATSFVADSPQQRFYLLENPVSFCRVGAQILRYSGYGFNASQAFPPAAVGQPLLGGLLNESAESAFAYSQGSLQRNASVQLSLRLGFDSVDPPLQFHHEVNVPNVP